MSLPHETAPHQTVPDEPAEGAEPTVPEAEEYGSLTVEDDPGGTVDPAELAGTADEDDADVR